MGALGAVVWGFLAGCTGLRTSLALESRYIIVSVRTSLVAEIIQAIRKALRARKALLIVPSTGLAGFFANKLLASIVAR